MAFSREAWACWAGETAEDSQRLCILAVLSGRGLRPAKAPPLDMGCPAAHHRPRVAWPAPTSPVSRDVQGLVVRWGPVSPAHPLCP